MNQLIEKHLSTIEAAIAAVRGRYYWTPFPELPSVENYGDGAKEEGYQAFEAYRNTSTKFDFVQFDFVQLPPNGYAGKEESPYGLNLNIVYPYAPPLRLVAAAQRALSGWGKADPELRAAVCMEILQRLNQRSFEIAYAVMHTTGQGFMMAFQAGGPHAQDRGLEAVAVALDEMRRVPKEVHWEKPQGPKPPLKLTKKYQIVPRGIGLVIGCSTFPTWNSYPGIFANLACGNAVIVKPHPTAILPLAITVAVAREVLKEVGFDPNVVCLAPDEPNRQVTKELALHPDVRIIDYTGSSIFGRWLEENAHQAQVYAEKGAVNCVIIDSTSDYPGMLRNLALTLSLYSGQMCTTPQVLFVPATGVRIPDRTVSADELSTNLASAIDKLLLDPARACEILGCIQSSATLARLEDAAKLGEVTLESKSVAHPQFPDARVRTPLLLKVAAVDELVYQDEVFGLVSFIVVTNSTQESIKLAHRIIRKQGSITLSAYSTDEPTVQLIEAMALDAKVALSVNLTGGVLVNQSAAFSDFHGTPGNPASNTAFGDPRFVSNRFRVVQGRYFVET